MSIRAALAFTTIVCLLVLPKTALGACGGSADFLARIQLINTMSPSLPTVISTDFENAYCGASDVFRRHLDGIDYIFLDGAGCVDDDLTKCGQAIAGSWGLRGEGGYTEIGISAHLWNNNAPAMKYDAYETAVLNKLQAFPLGAPTYQSSTTSTPLNTSWLTVLAVMAHEIGHVRWFEINARAGYGHPFDFKRMKDCNFFGKDKGANRWGWKDQRRNALAPKNRWRSFGDRDNEIPNDHVVAPKIADFTIPADRAKNLDLLLSRDQPWATYLGANAPDEDFVETYKLSILVRQNPGLNSMIISVPLTSTTTSTQDVYADFLSTVNPKTKLKEKVSCVRKFD